MGGVCSLGVRSARALPIRHDTESATLSQYRVYTVACPVTAAIAGITYTRTSPRTCAGSEVLTRRSYVFCVGSILVFHDIIFTINVFIGEIHFIIIHSTPLTLRYFGI